MFGAQDHASEDQYQASRLRPPARHMIMIWAMINAGHCYGNMVESLTPEAKSSVCRSDLLHLVVANLNDISCIEIARRSMPEASPHHDCSPEANVTVQTDSMKCLLAALFGKLAVPQIYAKERFGEAEVLTAESCQQGVAQRCYRA